LTGLQELGRYAAFAAQAFPAAISAVLRPGECARQLYHVYVRALPLSSVTGLALGVVIWLHLHGVLLRSGPGNVQLLPQLLALAVVLELAPLAAGLVVAGRSGAGLAAELGTLRLTEQVDALEALGLSPMRYLVGPRVLACMVALPLLTVLVGSVALLGGLVAELVGGILTPREYWTASLAGLRLNDLLMAPAKTVVFGFLIGTVACFCGLEAHGGTEGVGHAATRGVVWSILLLMLSDVCLVRAFQ
jgi:phospholipid/cholesterol/gamma-HCH transport system permease protein